MSRLGRAVAGLEQRSGLAEPEAWLTSALGATPSYSGKSVTVDSAFQLVPVYSAVALLAGSIGSLPLVVYRRLERGRERAGNHRMWRLLHVQPNEHMAADEVWELIGAHLLLWGNAFLGKIRDRNGLVSELWPLRPSRVQVGVDEGGRRFFILDGEGRYTAEDILHIRGLGTDGVVGLSPVQQARQALGAGMALEEFTGTFWANSASPGGVLSHPNRLSQPAADRLRAQWKHLHGGSARAGEVAVLEEGMEWKSTGMPLEDAQFIETQQFSNLQVAQLFRIPPYMLGAKSGDSLTYSNTESQGIDFVRWSLRRWLVRIEGALLRDPSLFVQGQRFYPEFLVDALLRADTKSRYEAYRIAIEAGFLTVEEVRELENRNPIPQEEEPVSPNGVPSQLPEALLS